MARLTRRALSLDFLAPAFPGELVRDNFESVLEEIARTCSDTRIRPLLTLVLTGPNVRIGGLGVTAFY